MCDLLVNLLLQVNLKKNDDFCQFFLESTRKSGVFLELTSNIKLTRRLADPILQSFHLFALIIQ